MLEEHGKRLKPPQNAKLSTMRKDAQMKVILKSSLKTEMGWIAPDGSFFPCSYENCFMHEEIARLIVESLPECKSRSTVLGNQNYLMQIGYIRIDVNILPKPHIGLKKSQVLTLNNLKALWEAEQEKSEFAKLMTETIKRYIEDIVRKGYAQY